MSKFSKFAAYAVHTGDSPDLTASQAVTVPIDPTDVSAFAYLLADLAQALATP